jgi:hypothetical protein
MFLNFFNVIVLKKILKIKNIILIYFKKNTLKKIITVTNHEMNKHTLSFHLKKK